MRILAVIFWCLVNTVSAAAADTGELEAALIRIQESFDIPGVSIAVVRNSESVVRYNHGRLNLDSDVAVTATSVFPIASTTKAFTATAIGILVDREKLGLDDRIVDHLPWFELSDAYVTEHLTIRDVLSHRSGLSSEGLIYMGSGFDRMETVKRLKHMPVSDFRAAFRYSNILYNAIGLIIEEVSGLGWEEFVQKNIFDVTGMADSFTARRDAASRSVANAHLFVDYDNGRLQPVKSNTFPASNGPAGAIYSTATDLTKFLNVILTVDQTEAPLIRAETLKEMWQPQNTAPVYWSRNDSFSSYGLGWFLTDYENRRLMFHPGGGGGVSALILAIPSESLSIAVLANSDTWATFALAYTVLDHLLGLDPINWTDEVEPYETSAEEMASTYAEYVDARVLNTSPFHSAEVYAGVYRHTVYGDVTVEMTEGALVMKRGRYISDLSHWEHETFKAIERGKKIGFDTVTFYTGDDGAVNEMMLWDQKGFFRN
jgi:CubicO group peptidase (beta-lactamase class C family)